MPTFVVNNRTGLSMDNGSTTIAVGLPLTTEDGLQDEEYSQSECGVLFAFLISFILGGLFFLFGIVGNSLAIAVLQKEKTATGLLLTSLAFADISIVTTLFLMKGIPALFSYVHVIGFFDVYPYLLVYGWPCASVAHSAGCWITVLVTFNRYVSVCLPYKVHAISSMSKVRIQLISLIIFVIVFNLPTFCDNYLVQEDSDSNTTILVRHYTKMGANKTYQIVYKSLLFYLLMYVIPLIALIVLTVRLTVTLKETTKRRAEMTNKEVSSRETTVMLVAVVIVFIACQSLVPLRRVLEATLQPQYLQCPYLYFYYAEINVTLVIFNSACNFVIYCIFGKRFRQSLLTMLGVCLNKVGPEQPTAIFHTNNTPSEIIPQTEQNIQQRTTSEASVCA